MRRQLRLAARARARTARGTMHHAPVRRAVNIAAASWLTVFSNFAASTERQTPLAAMKKNRTVLHSFIHQCSCALHLRSTVHHRSEVLFGKQVLQHSESTRVDLPAIKLDLPEVQEKMDLPVADGSPGVQMDLPVYFSRPLPGVA